MRRSCFPDCRTLGIGSVFGGRSASIILLLADISRYLADIIIAGARLEYIVSFFLFLLQLGMVVGSFSTCEAGGARTRWLVHAHLLA